MITVVLAANVWVFAHHFRLISILVEYIYLYVLMNTKQIANGYSLYRPVHNHPLRDTQEIEVHTRMIIDIWGEREDISRLSKQVQN